MPQVKAGTSQGLRAEALCLQGFTFVIKQVTRSETAPRKKFNDTNKEYVSQLTVVTEEAQRGLACLTRLPGPCSDPQNLFVVVEIFSADWW